MSGLSTPPRRGPVMRLPRVRFTVRRMLVTVAVVALYLGAEATMGRGPECRDRARSARRMALSWERFARSGSYGVNVLNQQERAEFRRRAEESRQMARQCE